MVGATGSGKTTLAQRMIDYRTYVAVMATKNRDPSLYPELMRKGYVLSDDPELNFAETPKVIFRPKLEAPTAKAKVAQTEAFREVLVNIFNEGGWCVYGDEVRYLVQNLGLATELETLWLQGRSLGVSMVVSTQRPVSIPVLAFESATHLFLFRATDRVNIQRASEFAAADADAIRYTLPRLPRYEVLHIDTRTGAMQRTKVNL
jgi:hypothetical protein